MIGEEVHVHVFHVYIVSSLKDISDIIYFKYVVSSLDDGLICIMLGTIKCNMKWLQETHMLKNDEWNLNALKFICS